MKKFDEQRVAFYNDHWHSLEFSAIEKEEVLRDRNQHQYLAGVWDSTCKLNTWLQYDSVPGHTIVDCIGTGSMSLVCRAFTKEGRINCIKLPNYDEHSEDRWDMLEQAIRNESHVIEQLVGLDSKFGRLPKHVDSGAIRIAGRDRPFVVTEYCFSVKVISRVNLDSKRSELEFWTRAAKLLGEVHDRRIVHGDVHEGNLMVDSAMRPVLLDFGNGQILSRSLIKRKIRRRHFGPVVAMHVDEVASPHSPLTPAFDVMCLMELANTRLGMHFGTNNKGQQLLTRNNTQAARYQRLLHVCRTPEPEYRLRNGSSLAIGLENLRYGPPVNPRRSLIAHLKVISRRYPGLVASAFVVCFTMLACVVFLLARQHQLKLNADRLRASNVIAIESMSDVLESSVERDRFLTEISGSDRIELGNRLIGLMRSDLLANETRLMAISLGLQIAVSVMELDGWELAAPLARECAVTAKRVHGVSNSNNAKWFELQANAILSRVLYEQGGLENPKAKDAISLSQYTAEEWLEADASQLEPGERELYIRSGVEIAKSLYQQRSERWFKDNKGEKLWQVLNSSIRIAEIEPEELVQELTALRRLYGLAIHKGAFDRFSGLAVRAPLVQEQYLLALDLLKTSAGNDRGVSKRVSRQIEAAVKSVLGMSYTNEDRYEDAQQVLSEAFSIREISAKEFPGSLRHQREFISTGWNYADAIQREAIVKFESSDTSLIHKEEIAIRTVVVERCKEVLAKDRNSDSEMDFLVNSVRLATAHILVDQTVAANRILLDVEDRLGIDCFEFPRLGLEGIVVLALLTSFNTGEHYERQLHEYAVQLNRYTDERSTQKEPRRQGSFAMHSEMFVHAADSLRCEELERSEQWQSFKHSLVQWKGHYTP